MKTQATIIVAAILWCHFIPAVRADSFGTIADATARFLEHPGDIRAADELIALASHENGVVRVNAIAALGTIAPLATGNLAQKIADALVAFAEDLDPAVRRNAYRSLTKVPATARIASAVFVRGLMEEDSDVAVFAAEASAVHAAGMVDVVEALSASVRRQANLPRPSLEAQAAVTALAKIGLARAGTREVLDECLKSPSLELRSDVLFELAKMNALGHHHVQSIYELSQTPNIIIRIRIIDIVSYIVDSSPLASVRDAIIEAGRSDPSIMVRERAREVEATLGTQRRKTKASNQALQTTPVTRSEI